jgi:hypothetical protein
MYEENAYGEIRRPEHDELPGRPSKSLVRKVRSVLWQHLRCRPHRTDEAWRMAWEWAKACEFRESLFRFGKSRRRSAWPNEQEIASQYLLLALARMRESYALRLPHRATECVPPSVKHRFIGIDPGANSGSFSAVALITSDGHIAEWNNPNSETQNGRTGKPGKGAAG